MLTYSQKHAVLYHAVTEWDRRCNKTNIYAGVIALGRLDEIMRAHESGQPIERALREGFQDRRLLLICLKHATKHNMTK